METKYKVLLAGFAVGLAFMFGRFSAPTKVVTETKIIQVEKKTEQKDTDASHDKHKKTTITETTKPDGTKETKTVVDEDSETKKKSSSSSTDDKSKSESTVITVERDRSRFQASLLVGATALSLPIYPVYGAHVTKDLLGPISVGVWGVSSGVGGLSVGLSF